MTLLAVHDLRKAFGGVQALRGISFEINAGEAVALIGPNGAGKTTCFNAIGGQLPSDAGRIELAGESLIGRTPHEIWRLGVGRTFQVASVFPSMTVRENVQVAAAAQARALAGLFRPLRNRCRAETEALLDSVGLGAQAERACGLLAYGDLKRLELALALSNQPRLLLMDEPTAGVAAGERSELMAMIMAAARERGITVLFTEHDMDVVFGHAERIVVLHRGELLADGTPDAVRADARVREVYLGESADVDESTETNGQGGKP